VVAAGLLLAAPALAQNRPASPQITPRVAPPPGHGAAPHPASPAPASAPAPAGPDLSVRNVSLAGIDGDTARLNIFLAQPGAGQSEGKVQVFWVEGGNRTKLWEGQSRFAGTRDGFLHTATVTLPAHRGHGRIEVVAGEQSRDPNWANNVKAVDLADGGDLSFGQPQIQDVVGGTPNRILHLTVRNQGPGAIPAGCKVQLRLAEQGPARTFNFNLPAIPPGHDHAIDQRYNFRSSSNREHNTVAATIQCSQDPVGNNNQLTLNLR
jgi:hypothetical protein